MLLFLILHIRRHFPIAESLFVPPKLRGENNVGNGHAKHPWAAKRAEVLGVWVNGVCFMSDLADGVYLLTAEMADSPT